MKKILSILLVLALVFGFCACAKTPTTDNETTEPESVSEAVVENAKLRLSTTTSVNDSGLLPYLLPVFEAKTGYKVEVNSAGTGAAIKFAQDGNADLILVHAKASEETFVADGFGVERIPFMYNYFVIVGPKDDPAGIKDAKSANEAFNLIAEAKAKFVSRGDESGTHKAELKIWGDGAPDAAADSWYISAGQGMGACLNMASSEQAYCLTDKATFLSMADELDLDIILAEGEDMKNTYSLIECNPEKLEGLNTAGAKAFIDWMTSEEALKLIADYGTEQYGQPLFYVIEE